MRGLILEREKLEHLAAEAAKVSAELPAGADDNKAMDDSWYNSRIAESIGYQAGQAIGQGLVELFRNLIPSKEQIAAARARAAASAAPHSAPAAIPAPVPLESRPPGQTASNEIHVDGLVGHIEDRRAPSPLATEPFSAHTERLDLETDVRDQVRQRKLSGPILGAEDPANRGNHPHSDGI